MIWKGMMNARSEEDLKLTLYSIATREGITRIIWVTCAHGSV